MQHLLHLLLTRLIRDNYEAIAADFLKTDIDVFIGGGINHFAVRKDKRDLLKELRQKGYQVVFSMDSIKKDNTWQTGRAHGQRT